MKAFVGCHRRKPEPSYDSMSSVCYDSRVVDLFREHLHILACPGCGSELAIRADALGCTGCEKTFAIQDGIPLLFHPHDPGDKRDVTDIVKAFYEETPFPNYDDLDTRESLQKKARR